MERSKIEQLSASVINKIAAGEVIERPASVVKELLENAIDAGGSRVDLVVHKGGTELVRVTDDGCGIPADELQLAVASHATSKLRDADDLYRVATMGFRGEALASIAEVSQFRLRSRPADTPAATEIEVAGGKLRETSNCAAASGTTVEVRNLFFNTPVRRKFLRTTQTELGHCSEAFARIALAHPDVHFTFSHNDRVVHDLSPVERWKERIAQLAGREIADRLIWVESLDSDVRLWGYVADPAVSRGNTKMQYLFLNGRYVRDRSLQHALGEAYRGLLMHGRFPVSFLAFEMPPEQVDVNVHPAKLEVRFADGGRHYSQLLGTLRDRFLSSDLTARLEPQSPGNPESAVAQASDEQRAADDQQQQQQRQDLVNWAQQQMTGWDEANSSRSVAPAAASAGGEMLQLGELDPNRLPAPWRPSGGASQSATVPTVGALAPSGPKESELAGTAATDQGSPLVGETAPAATAASAMQVHNRYLVAETNDGIMIIDQHALHERILYEMLREKVTSGALESQRLLVPEPVDLGPAEAAAAVEHEDLLQQLGIVVEPFGGETVLVSSYPAMLSNLRPDEIVRDVTEKLCDGKHPDRRELLDNLLSTIACKAAIKAGDRLSPEEVEALIEQRHLVDDSHHCPHGRPTVLEFSREQLDKQFKRI